MDTLPKAVQNLISEYAAFETRLQLRNAKPGIEGLVRFNGNKTLPIHGWYVFKEGFSADLLTWLCEALPCDLNGMEYILDPFCGVGTTLLSAQLAYQGKRTLYAYGVEHNPFIRFVARAKLGWSRYHPEKIEKSMVQLLAPRLGEQQPQYPLPELSTIHNLKAFRPSVVQELLSFRHRIQIELKGQPEEDFFLLGWTSIIERVSGVRKDGRALRFEDKHNVPTVQEALRDQWQSMLQDLREMEPWNTDSQNIECQVLADDGRILSFAKPKGQRFDLIVYSPPYLNNIDYSEVYKLELWLSGLISNQQEFRSLRLGTLRSHPSIKFPETELLDTLPKNSWVRRLQRALLASLPYDRDRLWRERLVRGYMDDMYEALSAQFRIARPGAPVVCVVGNSLHGRREHPIPVATDLLISAIAQAVGFTVEWLQIARQLRRRDHANKYLRETIIAFRKPQ